MSEESKDQANPSASERIAAFIVKTRFEDLPAAVVEKAKAQIAYHLGLALAASSNEEARQLRELVRRNGLTQGDATVIGERFRLRPSDAAFANTTLIRALWRDDVVFPAGIYAGSLSLAAALAIAEVKRASGRELLLALTLAYEVLGKLGRIVAGRKAPMPQQLSMIFGGFGSVTAAGRLLQLDRARMAHALGFASNLCMGVPEGGMTDHYYSLIVRNGTLSAQLAQGGAVTYGRTTIEGATGLYWSFFGEVPAELPKTLDALGSDWEILRADYKFHHATVQNIVAIVLLLQLAKEHALRPEHVAAIEVTLSPKRKVHEEALSQGPFAGAHEMYYSIPYALSRALVAGKVTAAHYTAEAMRDESANALMRRINARFEEEGHESRHCRLRVRTLDGRSFEGHSDGFNFQFPRSEWRGWLAEHGREVLPLGNLRRVSELIADLERLDDVSVLMRTLTPAASGARKLQ